MRSSSVFRLLSSLRRLPGDRLRRLVARPASPTADLYFLNACADAIGFDGPVRRLAPTVFATAEAVLVLRHDVGAEISPRDRRRIIYLLDDAVFAGQSDTFLPRWYRAKLTLCECAAAQRLLPRADILAVSNPLIAETLPAALRRPDLPVVEVAPYWSGPLSTLAHFQTPSSVRVGFTGAQTHAAGLTFVAPAVMAFLSSTPQARFEYAAGHRPPTRLARHPQVVRLGPMAWQDYRADVSTLMRHIALYPVVDTLFGRARSINKLIEHAVMGAAPLYSDTWAPGRAAAREGAGLALPDDWRAWAEALCALAAAPAQARALAAGAVALAAQTNRPDPQRALWARLLGLPAFAGAAR